MEAIEFDHHSITTYYRSEPPFDLYHQPTTTTPPPPPSHVHVHIDFLHQTTHHFYNWAHLDHNHDNENHHRSRPELVAMRRPPPVKASICIPAHTFKSYTASHGIISPEVKELQLHPSFEGPVANQVIATCLRVLNSVSNMGRRIVTVRINLATVQVHEREEREWVERGLAESLAEESEGGQRRTAAASMAAVRGLKRKRVVKDGVEESCRVCLEEFMKGERVTIMPCRHVFHEGCIETWLGTNHVCPICRFKMPTS